MGARNQAWAWAQRTIGPVDKLVLVALADDADADGVIWLGIGGGIAEKCGLGKRALQACVARLRDGGLLAQEREVTWLVMALPDHAESRRESPKGHTPPVSPPQKASRQATVTEEYLEHLEAKYGASLGGAEGVRLGIERAMNHVNVNRWRNVRIYLDGWLRREVKWSAPRTGTPSGPPRSGPRATFALEDYYEQARKDR